ncbi:hypothetical protein [Rheinheimera sp. 1928-s]|uniref:hypothetical protein n=1 Tax=Rheinheimera sp. 1928-s TaxID=3033803 RepID=UPI002636429B|nr:hypothetical protein [Rheinheimera sp. 1928-s]MDF3124998.1 hypothetical protein [Rheinheimera sp. 1928-s]
MKWIFAAVAILVIGLLAIKGSDWLPAAELKIDDHISVIVNPAEPTASANKVLARLDTDLVPEHVAQLPQSEAVELSSALCLEGRGCTLDLHENWHLKLLNNDGGLLSSELEAVFKSRNFIEAAEQLHYSRQKADDHKTELKLEQLMLIAVKKFQAEPQALGCRDNICLLQINVPRDIKVDDVRKSLMDPDLSWHMLSMSKQKSKYNWSLRFVATVDDKVVLSKP